jgi:hypothetical protein
MGNPNDKADEIVEILANRLGKLAFVYEGWPNRKHVKDLRRTRGLSDDLALPEVSITRFVHWPNHLEVNVWTQSSHERDEVSHMVVDVLTQIRREHKIGIGEISAHDITFEEKGVINPGEWDVIKESKPVFRELIQVSLLVANKTQSQADDGL